ncbi:MAG: 50S ribosomal protein L6 [Candidatus Hatepunaea meridiana]|nr:50S ribosomal protein L6 [Candidatus Hatepunaea meridiana]
MSRVGREPIHIPDGVKVTIDSKLVKVNGKLGELQRELPTGITVALEEKLLRVGRKDDSRNQKALHGLSRSLLANMVTGVASGFKKELEIIGVGYRCEKRGKALQLSVGFSHKVIFIPPEGIEIEVKDTTKFSVNGINNEIVGDIAAKIRAVRPPEPYKGKGIKYVGEYIRRKAGKSTIK